MFDNESWKIILKKYPDIHLVKMNPKDLVFEDRVKMNCFYCGRYNSNWRCPPKLPDIDYQKMVTEYKSGMFVYLKLKYTEDNYSEIRNISSVILHKALLEMEKYMWNHNDSTSISFIGGSCKLCKNGCGKESCNNPYLSRTPLEAIGVNIYISAKKYDIDLSFPPKESLMRLGLLLFD